MTPDVDRLWQALEACDQRFDGWVFCGVKSTGIYCRPSCAARTPKPENVRLFTTAAAAQSAGFRACKRCRPDAAPGSPEWDRRADLVGRTMRLIADGVVDREGVGSLARRLGYSERRVHRELAAVIGMGPRALARAQRAHRSAQPDRAQRVDRERATRAAAPDSIELQLPYRRPFDGEGALDFLTRRVVAGVEEVFEHGYRRSLRLPHGAGIVALDLPGTDGHLGARYWLDDLRDLGPAVQRSRALLDLDSDPEAVVEALGDDELLGPLVHAVPGRRVVGQVDADELAVRAVLGQQVSLASASTIARRLVAQHGEPLKRPVGGVTHVFPTTGALATLNPAQLAMPASRRRALLALCGALASGELVLDQWCDRPHARRQLLALPGIGEWTAGYIAMRALRDPDAFIPTDLGVRHALEQLGVDGSPGNAGRLAEDWRPYRAYALQHLWGSLAPASRKGAPRNSQPKRAGHLPFVPVSQRRRA